ncbi:hypothetical protein GPECTOR_320g27 [Gonium pectorale]|uniref:Uncharacterized protein n=1 Tax=Gonium pectorale TaxID=33097 RepID=A0A150FVQ2_GONPE|nr:hypothetical protein GPECTOR_320g27 [Gonium pectorale]|eukprot:KXZ41686.1 hypothetical protein GPECTOR_320g27 [Gonium pectorale]
MLRRHVFAGLSLQFNSCLPGLLGQTLELTRCLSTSVHSCEEAVASSRGHDELPSTSGRGSVAQTAVDWDWEWVLGKKQGRKPGIKRPSRHQWLYCNPNYDPAKPLPLTPRSPFAPPEESIASDNATINWHLKQQPENRRDRRIYLRRHSRFAQLREFDWRDAFERGLAEDVRATKRRERHEAEAERQRSWQQYKEALFERARLEGQQGR